LLILLFLTLQIAVSETYCDYGSSGWTIFKKIHGTQFASIALTGPRETDYTGFIYNPAVLRSSMQKEFLLLAESGTAGDTTGALFFIYPVENMTLGAAMVYYTAGVAFISKIIILFF
ncbi:hypothetical protein ACFLTD_04160, partial [Elusimicrobiota bacterium]